MNVNERLSKLEEELDQLISLQEKIKVSKANNLDYGEAPQYSENMRQVRKSLLQNSNYLNTV